MAYEDRLKAMALEVAKEKFTTYEDMTEEERIWEGTGLLLAWLFQWNGINILRAASVGLTDSNYHTESEIIDNMVQKILAEIDGD